MKTKIFVITVLSLCCILTSCNQKAKQADAIKKMSLEIDSIVKTTPVLSPGQVEKTNTLVEAYTEYAEKYPDDTLSPIYLFEAANKKMIIPDYKGAVKLFDALAQQYPNHALAPKALMSAGTISEKMIGNIDDAKKYYTMIKEKYPNDALANGIDLVIEYTGKSDEELFNAVMQKKAEEDSLRAIDSSAASK